MKRVKGNRTGFFFDVLPEPFEAVAGVYNHTPFCSICKKVAFRAHGEGVSETSGPEGRLGYAILTTC